MRKSLPMKIRKLHRWMGVILGIQFLFWTIGGIYFSWSDMDEVHGDYQKAHLNGIPAELKLANPQMALDQIRGKDSVQYIHNINLIQILGHAYYQILYSNNEVIKTQLANAQDGELRGALTEEEAIAIAKQSFNGNANVLKVRYVTETNGHHEYREQPLPAYAVTFDHPTTTTVYVSSNLGTVQKFRNDKWRIFDFLWMMHTMDYKSRDNLSNWLLKIFSIFGLVTILSGFTLFFVSNRIILKRK